MRRLMALWPLFLVAADWPQWLGPNRDGSTSEIIKPWTAPPKVLWRAEVGEGHSSPIVVGDRVYLLDKVPGQDAERLRSWAAATGQAGPEEAAMPRKPFTSMFGNGPRSTPAAAGDLLVTFGVAGDYRARVAGQPSAQVDLLDKFRAPNLRFGISASPLIEGDLVILLVGGAEGSVVALDRKTGEVRWKSQKDAASYAAPIAINQAGQRVIVCLTADGVIGLNPKDGSLFWRHPFRDLLAESSTTPVQVGDLLIASSVTLGSVALRLTQKDGQPGVELAWKNPQLSCYFSTPAAVGDHLYMVTGSVLPPPAVTLRCVEKSTGKILWSQPKVGEYHAALLRTGDQKLLMHSDTGDLTLIDPSPSGYRELARAKVCGKTWAHPAIANGRIFLRDGKELLALQLAE